LNVIEFIESDAFLGRSFARKRFRGDSWRHWKTFLRCLFGLPLTAEDARFAFVCTGRNDLPAGGFAEANVLSGRRSGKSAVVSAIACFMATQDYTESLSAGETAVIPVISATREQAAIIFSYVRSYLTGSPALRRMISSETKDAVELVNGFGNKVSIEIFTSDFRSSRGRACPCILLDELNFFETSSDELLVALRPSQLQFPHPLLLGISSAHRRTGPMFKNYEQFFAKNGAQVLFWKSTSLQMNLTLSRAAIALARLRDPQSAKSEYDSQWRDDLSSFLSEQVVDSCIVKNRRLVPFQKRFQYHAFVDPSGGRSDSMTMCLSHEENGKVVVDLLEERLAPFSPSEVVAEFAGIMKYYGTHSCVGDRYSAAWCEEEFLKNGVVYNASELSRSQLYLELLPAMVSQSVELPDHAKLRAQLLGLERKAARTQDLVDHGPNGSDDCANAMAGSVYLAGARTLVFGMLDLAKKYQTGDVALAPEPTTARQKHQVEMQAMARGIRPYRPPTIAAWNPDPAPPCSRCGSTCTIWLNSASHCNSCSNDDWPRGKPKSLWMTRSGPILR
jgi:hypothetical protein